ncbi:hypothetical protein NOVO_05555 [Rickettsiales bacterium Ac37b]|nr:hypothetical protein NOVO_05555 [Rickettsiales bacterium Ac37b]
MEKQGDFDAECTIRQDIYMKTAKFMLYRIWLINSNKINKEMLLFIFKKYLNISKRKIVSYVNVLCDKNYINYRDLIKEIVKEKTKDIRNATNLNGYIIQCLLCKDEKYVIKKP